MQNAIAVISDIHSNFEALTAVLDDMRVQEVTQVVCLGDIVGYASSVQSCMRAVRERRCPVLLGNHDEAACLLATPPTDSEAEMARKVLLSTGINPDGTRINPLWN